MRHRGEELGREAHQWMLLSAASLFLCGSCLSIASVVLCYQALQDAEQGALAEAARRLKWGKGVTVLGALLSLFGFFLVVALRTVG